MSKKLPAQFLIPTILFFALMIVVLAIINSGKDGLPLPKNEKFEGHAESLEAEDGEQIGLSNDTISRHSSPEGIQGNQLDEQALLAEPPSLAPVSADTEEALVQRELTRANIAAEYSSSGDGTLTEADFRRYAEERYLKRRDLNGNGRLEGFELRAIGESQGEIKDDFPSATNNSREI